MKVLRLILDFVLLCMGVLGLLGGIGYLVFYHRWAIAVGVLVLGLLAAPQAVKMYKELLNGDVGAD